MQCGKEAGERFSDRDCAISHDIIDHGARVWSPWRVNEKLSQVYVIDSEVPQHCIFYTGFSGLTPHASHEETSVIVWENKTIWIFVGFLFFQERFESLFFK